jgi:hypothetical protein
LHNNDASALPKTSRDFEQDYGLYLLLIYDGEGAFEKRTVFVVVKMTCAGGTQGAYRGQFVSLLFRGINGA